MGAAQTPTGGRRCTPRARRRLRHTAVLVVTVALLNDGSATGLGGVTAAKLSGFSMAASTGASTVVAWENFDGVNGTNLNGTTTDGGGKVWTRFGGQWSIQSNRARSTSAPTSGLVINSGLINGSVEATITASGTYDSGVIFNSNSSGSNHLVATLISSGGGSIELWKRVSNTYTRLATVGGFGNPTNVRVRIETTATTVRVYRAGVLQITRTLTAAEQTTFKNATHTFAGVADYDGNATSTFENFHVDSP